jgi:hypothetical protein
VKPNCTNIVLTGKRCQEPQTPTPVTGSDGYCYYHGKIFDGLTTSAEAITLLPEDDE